MKTKILFVCLGNICRSPAADGVMKRLVEDLYPYSDEWEIDSAGIGSWHAGQLPDRRMRECGAHRGYMFDHRARQVTRADFDRFDYIIGMDEENLYDLRRLAPSHEAAKKILCLADYLQHFPGQKTVPDPYYGQARDFEFALDLIEDACEGLLKQLLSPQR
ncbi:MAG: low molecular weight phosphotyrosine protein phosphatase [Prevotella sp.]|nr:low molecular weight phosphotyrosine protein phosphatase [Prevotella sp.]